MPCSSNYPAAPPKLAVYETLKRILNALVTDLMDEVAFAAWPLLGATTLDDIRRAPRRLAALSPQMEAARAAAKEFLYASLYNSPGMEEAHAHATEVVARPLCRAHRRPRPAARRPPGADPHPGPGPHRGRLHRRHDR